MLKLPLIGALILITVIPQLSLAATQNCSETGVTILYINGILTSKLEAQKNLNKLQDRLGEDLGGEKVRIRLGYNPSHLGGVGDLVQAVTQGFGRPVSSYDLDTILMQIHPEVTTRKILLVGHSQGTFYTNEMYRYLVEHGVPRESIGVYNIATPASFVAGGGSYITSTNDKLISLVRDTAVKGNTRIAADSYYTISGALSSALRANVTLPKESDWETNDFGGHSFTVYLDGATERIVRDINTELGKLKAGNAVGDFEGCFEVPNAGITHKLKDVFYAVADPLVSDTSSGVSTIYKLTTNATQSLYSGLSNIFGTVAKATPNTQIAGAAAATAGGILPQLPAPQAPSNPQPSPVIKATVSTPAPKASNALTPSVPQTQTNPFLQTPPQSPSPYQYLVPVTPGFGGGGGGGTSAQQSSNDTNSQTGQTGETGGSGEAEETNPPEDTTAPDAPIITSGLFSNVTDFTISGTAETDAIVTLVLGPDSATTTAIAGSWEFSLALAEGEHEISFTATDAAGNMSQPALYTLTVDQNPPVEASVAIPACDRSLSASFCLLASPSTTVTWDAVVDAAYYGIVRNGSLMSTSTALSGSVSLDADATTTVAVVSFDAAGNSATSTQMEVATIKQPLVISEIAWGGTDISASDQWIEIMNASEYNLDLQDFTIMRSDGTSIPLSGTLPAVGQKYLVVEPFDIPFTDAGKKLVSPFPPLSTDGEQITLAWSDGTEDHVIDSTPVVETCGGWCAGNLAEPMGTSASGASTRITPRSMERSAGTVDGELASSWHSTDSYGPWKGTGAVWGTPGVENSAGLPDAGVSCNGELVQANAPLHPGTICEFMMRFIATNSNHYGAIYRGTVGSSTMLKIHMFNKGIYGAGNIPISTPVEEGEPFFFAIWEHRNGPAFDSDTAQFNDYFKTGNTADATVLNPPHGNYVTIPWTYAP